MPRVIRSCPPPPFLIKPNHPRGTCKLCGDPIHNAQAQLDRTRMWHPACRYMYRIASNSDIARCAVFMRDLGICRGCGQDCTSYLSLWPREQATILERRGVQGAYRVQLDVPRLYERCSDIVNNPADNPRAKLHAPWLGWWHVDHILALHLVDRSAAEAWRQWWLDNLQTLCQSCHEMKSAEETKARAKADRLRKGPRKSKKQKALERMQRQRDLDLL